MIPPLLHILLADPHSELLAIRPHAPGFVSTSYKQFLEDTYQLGISAVGSRSIIEARSMSEILASSHQVRQPSIGQTGQPSIDSKSFSKLLPLNIRGITSDRILGLTRLLVVRIYTVPIYFEGSLPEIGSELSSQIIITL
ncbi:hypothetical protein HOY82DRAFT_600136 [Tuber indicum]|nr:hypothetical protein HOY82DRAFT_600136 [Tuber indicum]